MTIEVKQRFSVHAEPATAIRNIHEICSLLFYVPSRVFNLTPKR
jgi:hypothetical protein